MIFVRIIARGSCCSGEIFSARTIRRRDHRALGKGGKAVQANYGVEPERLHIIPHGDLSASMGRLPSRAQARAALKIAEEERVCLVFGTVEPYKGLDRCWNGGARPSQERAGCRGKPFTQEYASSIRAHAGISGKIRLDLCWQSDEALKRWLAAADCVLFHYRAILTSGRRALRDLSAFRS